ncbi:dynamin family protein [Vibrio parahaemolyticus]
MSKKPNKSEINRIQTALCSLETLCKKTYGVSPFQSQLDGIKQLLDAEEFRIAVVGEFSAGKSTFINALIGYDLLPHARSETTATITYIHNVPLSDARCGKVTIEFVDARDALTLDISDDQNSLKDYVTSFSSQFSVVDEIQSVHVYTHFLNIKTPVVLVDTPGLNGTADGHRSITLAEVERAHASIFLFHLRALTETDLEFLKLLSKHQSRIFYLLNHIDSVNELEGESVGKVLKDFHDQISTHFSSHFFEGQECETFGISALKALVHKDTSFKKLYSSDLNELTDAERNSLWSGSRFDVFEQRLQHYIEHHSEHDVKGVALKGLASAINDIEDNLLQEIACIEQQHWMGNDERISRYLENLEDRKNKSWNKIKAYLNSRSSELENHTLNYLKDELIRLNDELQSHMKSEGLEQLQVSVNNNTYGKKINQGIMKMRTVIQRLLQSNIEDVYEIGILETARFTSEVAIDYQKSHKVGGLTFKLDSNIVSQESAKLDKEKGNLSNLEFDLKANTDNQQTIAKLQKKIQTELANNNANTRSTVKRRDTSMQRLGKRPDVEYITKTRTVERDGFFGGFLDIFSEKKETYRVADRSEQQRYDRELDGIRNQYTTQINTLNLKKNRLQAQLNEANSSIEISKLDQDRLEKKIVRHEKRIKEMKQHIESKLRNHRQQVTREKRNELCNKVETNLQVEALGSLNKTIKSTIKKELSLVSDKLYQYHKQKFELYRQKLELLDGQSKNLELPLLKNAVTEISAIKAEYRKN